MRVAMDAIDRQYQDRIGLYEGMVLQLDADRSQVVVSGEDQTAAIVKLQTRRTGTMNVGAQFALGYDNAQRSGIYREGRDVRRRGIVHADYRIDVYRIGYGGDHIGVISNGAVGARRPILLDEQGRSQGCSARRIVDPCRKLDVVWEKPAIVSKIHGSPRRNQGIDWRNHPIGCAIDLDVHRIGDTRQ